MILILYLLETIQMKNYPFLWLSRGLRLNRHPFLWLCQKNTLFPRNHCPSFKNFFHPFSEIIWMRMPFKGWWEWARRVWNSLEIFGSSFKLSFYKLCDLLCKAANNTSNLENNENFKTKVSGKIWNFFKFQLGVSKFHFQGSFLDFEVSD